MRMLSINTGTEPNCAKIIILYIPLFDLVWYIEAGEHRKKKRDTIRVRPSGLDVNNEGQTMVSG